MATATTTHDVVRSETHPHVGSYAEVNRDVLKILSKPGPGYLALVALAATGFAALGLAFLAQVYLG
ncbi:MAG TPA: hypothetical protein VEA38_16255, partial [Terriglobales bacterium]|nr:hypothetical protein [Terriglobales bacterium]